MSTALTAAPPPQAPGVRRRARGGAARFRPAAPLAETVLVLMLIAVSGNPVLSSPTVAPLLYVLLLALGLALRQSSTSALFLRNYGWLAASFCVVFAAHRLQLGEVSVFGAAHFLVKVFVAGWLIDRLGVLFVPCLFRATVWLCASSVLLYPMLLLVGPEAFPGWFGEAWTGSDRIKSIGFYTVHTTPEWWRNSSMMWEPGALQGVINLTLFLMPGTALLTRRYRLSSLLMVAVLATTFSTTGYLVFFLVVLYKLGSARLSGLAKSTALVVFLLVGLFTFLEADFLAQKIVEQYLDSLSYDGFMPDRFGALLFDLQYIDKHPLFGNGLVESTRFADHPQLHGQTLAHGNGLSNFIATFGGVGLLAYAWGILRCGWALGRRGLAARVALLVLVLILSVGEQFLNTPLFLGLPFLMLANLPRPRRRVVVRRPAMQPVPPAAAA